MKKIILAVMALAFTASGMAGASTTNQQAIGNAPAKIQDNAGNGKVNPGTAVLNGWPMNLSSPAFTVGTSWAQIPCTVCEKPPCFAYLQFNAGAGVFRVTKSSTYPTSGFNLLSGTVQVIDIAPGSYLYISGTSATLDIWY